MLGRGDGSFRSQKFTGIAAFLTPGAERFIRLKKVAKHSFGATEGSKGGAGMVFKIYTSTVAFISVHMSSKKNEARLLHYKELVKGLGGKLGNEFFHLTEQFHHVFWVGDTNYRCM